MKLTITKQFQSFIADLGISFEDLLRRANIPNLLWKEELNVSPLEYYRLLQEFDQLVTDEQIIAFSEIKNINMFMPSFFAALCARNGIEGLERFAMYKRLAGPVSINVQVLDEIVRVHCSFIYPKQDLPRFALLNEQLLILSLVRTGSGENITPLNLASPFKYGEEIVRWAGTLPEETSDNQMLFSLSDLQKPFLTHNNVMWEYLEPELKRKLVDLHSEKHFSNIVQSTLFYAIPSGRFGLEDVSQSLGISTRTLQRNLSAENTTFNQQMQSVQKTLALNYIQDSALTIADIAYLVGYTDPSSFSRAFKKWTGKTLSQYKESNGVFRKP